MEMYKIILLGTMISFSSASIAQDKKHVPPVPPPKAIKSQIPKNPVAVIPPKKMHKMIPMPPPPPPLPPLPPPPPKEPTTNEIKE